MCNEDRVNWVSVCVRMFASVLFPHKNFWQNVKFSSMLFSHKLAVSAVNRSMLVVIRSEVVLHRIQTTSYLWRSVHVGDAAAMSLGPIRNLIKKRSLVELEWAWDFWAWTLIGYTATDLGSDRVVQFF